MNPHVNYLPFFTIVVNKTGIVSFVSLQLWPSNIKNTLNTNYPLIEYISVSYLFYHIYSDNSICGSKLWLGVSDDVNFPLHCDLHFQVAGLKVVRRKSSQFVCSGDSPQKATCHLNCFRYNSHKGNFSKRVYKRFYH